MLLKCARLANILIFCPLAMKALLNYKIRIFLVLGQLGEALAEFPAFPSFQVQNFKTVDPRLPRKRETQGPFLYAHGIYLQMPFMHFLFLLPFGDNVVYSANNLHHSGVQSRRHTHKL